MAEIRVVHTARKAHGCEVEPACPRTIQPGDRYLIASVPPWDEDNQTDRWLRMKVCQPCAERWGQPIDEQVTQRRIDALPNPADGPATCARCSTKPAQSGVCCSSHGRRLCHLCYRRTHWVEVCVTGCPDCATENLPVRLSEVTR